MNAESRAPIGLVAGVFVVLSLVFTYPLPLHLASAVEDRQDALLNTWIVAWDGHQLLADPLHLFDANIFYPYPRTLAYSELLLGNALIALPITAATGNPVLGYNVALLLSFVLSGLGMYLLVLKLTRRAGAGLAAGLIFAFCSYRMSNLAQAQLLTTQWLPFTLLALHSLMERPGLRNAALFVIFFWLQAVSSFYYGLLLGLAVAGFWILDFGFWIVRRRPGKQNAWRSARYLALAACCLLLLLLPFILPYFSVQWEMGFQRTLADSEPFSASLRQYALVPPGSVLHGWLPSETQPRTGGYPVDALFPGVAAVSLAAIGVIAGRHGRRWLYLILLLAAVCLSFGPRLYLAPGRPADLNVSLPYAWLYAVVPGFRALRAPVRFDALVMLALAVLAGYGIEAITRRRRESSKTPDLTGFRKPVRSFLAGILPTKASWLGWAPLLAVVIILESLVWPGARAETVAVGAWVPEVYRWLAEQPRGAILELPMAFTEGGPQLDYQYLSTYHWQPTPDGYSGFVPPKHGQISYEMERFPSERSVSLLQALDVSYVVLHTASYPADRRTEMRSALAEASGLALVQTFGEDQVYRVEPRAMTRDDLRVTVYLPPRARAAQPYTAYVLAVNHGDRSYALSPEQAIQAAVRWHANQGAATDQSAEGSVPLVISAKGGLAVIPVQLAAPAVPGPYRMEIGQMGSVIGNWQATGTVEVGDQADDAFPVPARLSDWHLASIRQAGQSLPVDLAWQALGKIDAYYSVYVKLLDGQGNAVAGWDGQPRNGQAPTLEWVPGETITDTVSLDIPAATPAGEYTVEVGMYRAADLARCLLIGEDGALLDRVVVGKVRIEP